MTEPTVFRHRWYLKSVLFLFMGIIGIPLLFVPSLETLFCGIYFTAGGFVNLAINFSEKRITISENGIEDKHSFLSWDAVSSVEIGLVDEPVFFPGSSSLKTGLTTHRRWIAAYVNEERKIVLNTKQDFPESKFLKILDALEAELPRHPHIQVNQVDPGEIVLPSKRKRAKWSE